MSTIDLDIFKNDNAAFVKELSGPNATKVAEAAGLYIAQKLRERSFARQILTPRTVTRYDLKNSKEHDQLVFIDEKEINVGHAQAINFKAEPDGAYITTPRYEIPVQEISSQLFAKKEIELLASTQPVTKVLEEIVVREIEETEDGRFLQYAAAAAVSAGNAIQISQGAAVGSALTKTATKQLINLIDSKRLKTSTILMSNVVFNDTIDMDYSVLGSELLHEVTVDGYKYYNWAGRKLIVSIKNELFQSTTLNADGTTAAANDGKVRAPVIYGFADEKALGRFLVLDSTKFGVRKNFNTIEMMGWEYIAIGIGNNNAVSQATLTA
jgi:hypothetical protein